MAKLRFHEKNTVEKYLEMESGYVLDFSNRTFANLFLDFEIDIDRGPYIEGHTGSKANRMRAFLEHADSNLAASVLAELVGYAESYRPGHPQLEKVQALIQRLNSADETSEARAGKTENLTQAQITARPVEVFFSYAHEDQLLMDSVRNQLVIRERLGQIVKWHDRMIPAGNEWREQIDQRINTAHVILLFMSPDFLASRYCYEIEGEIALRRHREGHARVIPIILRPCDWTITPFGEFQALPSGAKPITQWADRDQATLLVAQGIMAAIE